ncbi:MAG: phosphate-starvation-inducible PsiE family protein, partial [Deferribacterales bacterium]|nr:phosphate-starvation-inducible PsiE family protein [Deferribacterales bacterium]
MAYIKDIRNTYNILDSDIENIKSVSEIMLNYSIEFATDIREYLIEKFGFQEQYEDTQLEKMSQLLEDWYKILFKGNINNDLINYTTNMVKIFHEQIVDNSTFLSIFSFVRNWIHERIFQQIEKDVVRKNILLSVHKILDVQVSIINTAYTDIELRKYTKIFSLKNNLINFSERFMVFGHLILVSVLISLTLGAIVFLGVDIIHHYKTNSQDIIIYALGSLLILWVLIELLHTEIQSIKGGKLKISIFLGVALIAFVREILIIKLQHKETDNQMYTAIAAILVLGIVYFITALIEKNDNKRRNK